MAGNGAGNGVGRARVFPVGSGSHPLMGWEWGWEKALSSSRGWFEALEKGKDKGNGVHRLPDGI